MGTVIERVTLATGGWRNRHSALRLAVTAGRDCLRDAGCAAHDVDLLINAGVYRDRNLGEPALAALIQQDIGANPEEPHAHAHGTFSFDVSNGSCGILTALQIADGFLTSHSIKRALIVAGDANPGHGMSEDFPFSAAAGALLCTWAGDESGFGRFHWVTAADNGQSFKATVGLVDRKNVLRFAVADKCDYEFADVAAKAALTCLNEEHAELSQVDAVIAAPAHRPYRSALAERLGVPDDRLTVAGDEQMHTAALAAAFSHAADTIRPGGTALLIAAGAGITAGASLYRLPGKPPSRQL